LNRVNLVDIVQYRPTITYYPISISDVFDGLTQLKLDPTSGTDSIPALFLNLCRYFLTYPLTYPVHKLFSLSLKTGIFPSLWKSSYVLPIWKAGGRSIISNYRPISKLSVLPKLFEKLIEPKLSDILKHTLINEQHGFRKNKSTDTNLLTFFNLLGILRAVNSTVHIC
jgi:hypothetical protein